ncbi:MAG: hypothetical protein PUA68_05295 [Bacilli bacterium]|nr:hypothetical protein [Bacilli bacterium]
MGKINIITKLENVNEKKFFSTDCMGLKIDNKIKFFDNNIGITITINDNEIVIDRRCDEYEIVIVASLLETKKGIYKIKGLGNLDLEVKTKKLEINDNGFEVNYLMILDSDNPQEFKYTVTYKE